MYVYKVPIFCSECEKPTGFAKNIFRCVLDEDKLCSVSHEVKNVKNYAVDFVGWLGNIVTKEIPTVVFNELSKIFELLKPIKDAINGLLDNVGKIFGIIKKDFIDKVTAVISNLTENITNMFIDLKDGTVNMANLIYQSIDNIKTNAINKISDAITDLLTKMGDVFNKIKDFFSGLADKITQPFRDFYKLLQDACIPEIPILPNELQIFPRIDIDVIKVHLDGVNIPSIKIPKFCPFDTLSDAFKKITDGISTAFNKLLDPIMEPFRILGKAITSFETTITSGIQTVQDFIMNKYNTIIGYITSAFEPIKTFLKNIGNNISDAYNSAKNFIVDKLTVLKDTIVNFFKDSFNKLYEEIYKLFKPVIDIIKEAIDTFKNVFKNFIASLNDLYILVKQKWDIVYKFVYDKILY